jgi:hypothetical protein
MPKMTMDIPPKTKKVKKEKIEKKVAILHVQYSDKNKIHSKSVYLKNKADILKLVDIFVKALKNQNIEYVVESKVEDEKQIIGQL